LHVLTVPNIPVLLFCPCFSCPGALRTLPPSKWEALNNTIAEASKVNKEFTTTKGNTAIAPSDVLKSVNDSIALFQDNSVFTLGQNTIAPGKEPLRQSSYCTTVVLASWKLHSRQLLAAPLYSNISCTHAKSLVV
jgi:hypothetical protein